MPQVCHFDINESRALHPDQLAKALNSVLVRRFGGALAVLGAAQVPCNVSARFDSIGKTYLYRMLAPERGLTSQSTVVSPPLLFGTRWVLPGPVDTTVMHEAARLLQGHHDFGFLRLSGCSSKTTHRHVHGCSLRAQQLAESMPDPLPEWTGSVEQQFVDRSGGGLPSLPARLRTGSLAASVAAMMRLDRCGGRPGDLLGLRVAPSDCVEATQSVAEPASMQSLDLSVRGGAFLYKQVRSMAHLVASAGLVAAGTWKRRPHAGRVDLADIRSLLDTGALPPAERDSASPSFRPTPAPAHGLVLQRVHIPPLPWLCRQASLDAEAVAAAAERDCASPEEREATAYTARRAAESARRVRRILWGHEIGAAVAGALGRSVGPPGALAEALRAHCPAALAASGAESNQEALVEALVAELAARVPGVQKLGLPVRLVLQADGLLPKCPAGAPSEERS